MSFAQECHGALAHLRLSRRAILLALVLVACSTRATGRTIPAGPSDPTGPRIVRVAIMTPNPPIAATGAWSWSGPGGEELASAKAGESWRIESDPSGRVRAVAPTGKVTTWQRSLTARAASGRLTVAGRRYRGSLAVVGLDSGYAVVNHVGIEDYLRGVVPVEMGSRAANELAALETQAVAARTFAYAKLAGSSQQPFDLRGSTADQAYGGYDAEYALSNNAVDATRNLVLLYGGRIANAVYSSTCGGTTARASEVWRMDDVPYLRNVSDAIPGTERHYCDIAPRFRWSRVLGSAELNAALAQYLGAYSSGPGGDPGRARMVAVRSQTSSGRADAVNIETARGEYVVRKNDVRYVLRSPGGELLNSTYFSVEPEVASDGLLSRVTLRGQGYGHGVGMCQWGAIGRARAGQSFRSILGTYYPGTTVGPVQ